MFGIDQVYTEWTWKRLSRHVAYWGFWLLFYPIINISYHDGMFLQYFLYELLVIPVKIINTYFIIYFLMPKYLYTRHYTGFIISSLFSCFVAGIANGFVKMNIVDTLVFGREASSFFISAKVIYIFLDHLNIATLVALIKFVQRHLQQEKSNNILKKEKLDAELKLLKNQLQPHFLFNTLNNLYGLVLTKDEKAPDVLVKMSDMLSYMLYECEDKFVSLEKEITILENYIELEVIRYGKKLSMQFDKQGNFGGKLIAPLLLFPLLENAFKHGPAKLEHSSTIYAKLSVSDEELNFEVENSKMQSENEDERVNSGIGLDNVRSRLELLYPQNFDLVINDQSDKFHVALKLRNI